MSIIQFAADEVRRGFTPTTWQAFWQTAVEDRTASQVASELGLSVGAVYIARSRVLAQLKRQIEKIGDDPIGLGNEDDQ